MPNTQDQPHTMAIGTHLVRRVDSVRTLLIDDEEVSFTPTEYRLLLRLLEGKPLSDRELLATLFNAQISDDLWGREALDKHLDNVRRKFRQHHVRMAIRRIATFGYILLPDPFVRKRYVSSST